MTDPLSIPETLAYARETLLRRFWLLLAIQITVWIPSYVPSWFLPDWWDSLVSVLLWSLLQGGFLCIQLGLVDGGDPHYGQLFSKTRLFWKFLLVFVCLVPIMTLCLVLLTTWTIIVSVPNQLAFMLIVVLLAIGCIMIAFCDLCVADEELGPIDSIRRSLQLTKGFRWKLLGLLFALIGISLPYGIASAIVVGIPAALVDGAMHIEFKRMLVIVIPAILLLPAMYFELVLAHSYRQLTKWHAKVEAPSSNSIGHN